MDLLDWLNGVTWIRSFGDGFLSHCAGDAGTATVPGMPARINHGVNHDV